MTAFSAFATSVNAENSFKTLGENILGNGMSSNGNYIVGVSNDYGDVLDKLAMKSFIYDTENDSFSWMTELNENDYSKGGEFKGVSNNGIICGNTKNTDCTINPIYGDFGGSGYASAAAIWIDGKCKVLEFGDFDTDKIHFSSDGSFSEDISAEGDVVIGNFITDGGQIIAPCKWVKNSEGEYILEWLELPNNAKTGYAKKISDDGLYVFGTITMDNNTYISIWNNKEVDTITPDRIGGKEGDACNMSLIDVSPNGRFVLILENSIGTVIYDMEENQFRSLPTFGSFDGSTINFAGIDNNGNVVSSYNYINIIPGQAPYSHPFWYSYERNLLVDYTYFMSVFATDIIPDIDFSFENKSQAIPFLISADGNVTAGNAEMFTINQIPKCWVLKAEINDTEIPYTPTGLSFKSKAIGEVTLTWQKDETVYENLKLKSYNIYRDGKKVGEVDGSSPEMSFTENGVAGHPQYVVEAVFQRTDGSIMLSQKSASLKTSVPDTYNLPFFENFDDTSYLDANYWTSIAEYGDVLDTYWTMEIEYGLYQTQCALIDVSHFKPHSSSLISRPMDATEEENITVSFMNIYGYMNVEGLPLDKDSISLDISTDMGDTWKEIKGWSIEELCPQHKWTMTSVDISEEAAGKIFQIRLRSHGQGVGSYYIQIDNLKITTGTEEKENAPEGLTGKQKNGDKPLTLMWKNPNGAYQINHINTFIVTMFSLGNEGKELIGANSFEPEDLEFYKGKYLTGVNTILNFYTAYEEKLGINASVVVFEDGKLIREQEIEDVIYNEYFTVKLNEPLLIDGNKELKIGIKIHDYDPEQIPLLYGTSEKFIPGKSDLYSEDNGATWNKVSEFYGPDDIRGYCCWCITGCITDTPELTITEGNSNELYSYNVFRNGEVLSTAALDKLQTRFIVDEPVDGDDFHVVAYYMNGAVSEPSEEFIFKTKGIEQNLIENTDIYFDSKTRQVIINGKFNYMDIISLNGTHIFRSSENNISLPDNIETGIYILRVQRNDNVIVKKIAVE